MPHIKTNPQKTSKSKETTVSPGIISEMRSFCYVQKDDTYEYAT